METKDVILELRTKNGLSQEKLAEKVHVTRQAACRWMIRASAESRMDPSMKHIASGAIRTASTLIRIWRT